MPEKNKKTKIKRTVLLAKLASFEGELKEIRKKIDLFKKGKGSGKSFVLLQTKVFKAEKRLAEYKRLVFKYKKQKLLESKPCPPKADYRARKVRS
ncbi:MAG: hypothetical protein WC650_03600 [Candidatus Doudnabacteria bacterium]